MSGGGRDHEFHRALAGVSLLSRLDTAMIGQLAELGDQVTLEAGEWLFRQGDDGEVLYVVLAGRLEVVSADGRIDSVVRTLTFGDVVGELSVLGSGPRSASVRARRDSTLLGLSRRTITVMCQSNPTFALALLESVGEKLRTRTSADPVPAPRSQVLTIVALDAAASVRDVSAALRHALAGWGDVAHLPNGDTIDRASWSTYVDAYERHHDFVVLDAASSEPADPWREFCTRQGDRVLGIAGTAPVGRHARHERWDLVVTGAAGQSAATRQWITLVRPRTHHRVRGEQTGADIDRLARRITGRSRGLVLSGGGARGLAHLGVLAELVEAGVTIDRIGGTSMGAFVAALFATGRSPQEMEAVCRAELVEAKPFRDFTWPRVALIRARRAQAMLTRVFGDTHFEDLVTDCFSVSADLSTAEVVVARRGPLVEAVGASMSLPGLAPPVRSGGRMLVDGGVLNNVPVDVMATTMEGPVIAVDVLSRRLVATSGRLPSIVDTLTRASVMGSRDQLTARLAAAETVIAPDVGSVGLLDFFRFDELVAAGRRAAREALDAGRITDPAS